MTAIAQTAVGLAALGRPAYLNLGRDAKVPAERSVSALRSATGEVLDRAYSAGIRRVDAARSYGRAEEFLAEWLEDRGHTDVAVSSKWGYAYVGGWRVDADVHEAKEHSLDRFRQQWRETQAWLGEVLGLYQVHSLTIDSPLFDDPPLLDALATLSEEGIRLGFSTSGPGQADVIRRGLELTVAGEPLFTAVQATWNPLEPSAGPDAVAVAAAYAQRWSDVVLVGPGGADQLESNLAGAALSLSSEEVAALAEVAESPADYWAHRASLVWH